MKASYTDETGAVIGPASGVTWASANPQVATIGDDGTITAVDNGHGQVTVTAPGGTSATVDVFVQGDFVVASSRSGVYQLYVGDRSKLVQLRRLVADTATDPAFSPDGSRIAFTSTTLRGARRDIVVMDADGTNATRIPNSFGSESHPQFTADGSAVVFQSERTGHSQMFQQAIGGLDRRAAHAGACGQFAAHGFARRGDDRVRLDAGWQREHLVDGKGRVEPAPVHAHCAARPRASTRTSCGTAPWSICSKPRSTAGRRRRS